MDAERVSFRMTAAISVSVPVAFGVLTIVWIFGLVLIWTDLTWAVLAPAVLFIAWLLSWWTRFVRCAIAWRRGTRTIFINLPWEIVLDEGGMTIDGFLLHVHVRPEHVVDVSTRFLGLSRIVIRVDDRNRVLYVMGQSRGVERIVEWCFYHGVSLGRIDQRM